MSSKFLFIYFLKFTRTVRFTGFSFLKKFPNFVKTINLQIKESSMNSEQNKGKLQTQHQTV